MKKLLLLLMALTVFAPPGKADTEHVRFLFGGDMSKLVNTTDPTKPVDFWTSGEYKATILLSPDKNHLTTKNWETFDVNGTNKTSYGWQLKITNQSETQGIIIRFTGTYDPNSVEKYASFNLYDSSNQSPFGGIQLMTSQYMQIESFGDGDQVIPIKSVSFMGRSSITSNALFTSKTTKYLYACGPAPDYQLYDNSTEQWSYSSNVLTYTPETPSKRIAFRANSTTRYIKQIEWEWDVPMAAPTVASKADNIQYAPTLEDGVYTYLSDGHCLRLKAPKDGCTIRYTIDGGNPTASSPAMPSTGIQLSGYAAGVKHTVRAVAIDASGEMGKVLTLDVVKARVPNPVVKVATPYRQTSTGVYDFIGEMNLHIYPGEGSPRAPIITWGMYADADYDYLGHKNHEQGRFFDKSATTNEYADVTVNEQKEGTAFSSPWPRNLEPDKVYYLQLRSEEKETNGNTTTLIDNDNYLVVPVRALAHSDYASIAELTENSTDHDGELVRFTCPLDIQYVHKTALPNTYFMYLTDPQGNAIKVVSRGNTDQPFPDTYNRSISVVGSPGTIYQIPELGLAGRYRHNEGFFEIEVKNSDADFMPFMSATVNMQYGADNPLEKYEQTTVDNSDFNRHLILRYMEKVDGNYVRDSEGRVIQVIDRFENGGFPWTDADNGKRYQIECTVGQYDGEIVIFPINRADGYSSIIEELPRPAVSFVGGNRIDESSEVNIINEQVSLRFEPDVPYTGEIQYQYSYDGTTWTPCGASHSFNVKTNGLFEIWVRSTDGAVKSCYEPVHLVFHHHSATPVNTIADFKEKFLDAEGNLNSGDISGWYRMDGEAVVEQVTPYYLYVRDNIATPGTRNHLLIYNANGWNNAPVVEDPTAEGGTRHIQPGDVITGFALIADRTPQGNLRSRATNYARTFEVKTDATVITPTDYDDLREVDYDNADAPYYYEKLTFGTDDRMMHYEFENVRVYRRHNPDYDKPDLKVIDNGDGTVTKYDGEELTETNIVDEWIYTLKLGPQDSGANDPVKGLDLRFNVFTGQRGGWITSYDPDRADEVAYTITGVVVRDENRSLTGYSLAMISFDLAAHAKAPAAIYLDGQRDAEPAEDDAYEFIYNGVVKIDRDPEADSRAVIYYTVDGTDPKTNRMRLTYDDSKGILLPADQRIVTVRSYAAWPGAAPSAEVSAMFRRTAEERTAIVNFLTDSDEDKPYHFGGNVRIVAVGGDYMFVRGVAGHYLAVHRQSDNALTNPWNAYTPGKYLTDFVVGIEKVGTDRILRGAKVTDDYAPFMSAPLESKPAGVTNEIVIDQPDEVTVITAANARRFVKITNVVLEGVEFEQEAEALATEWTLIPNRGHDKDHTINVNHTVLDYEMPEKGTEGKYYNLTGFVMLDEKGDPELWPTAVERVQTATPVTAEFDRNATWTEPVANTYVVDFYPSTVVTLKYDGPRAQEATIRYIFTEGDETPADDAKWNVFGQPFAVTTSGYIHALVEIPGMEESVHTHIELTLGEAGGTVDFSVKAAPGATTVTMTAAEGSEIFWTDDNTLPYSDWTKYADQPVTFDADTRIYAYALADGKPGAVSSMFVMVLPEGDAPDTPTDPGQPENPADRISGRVKFELTDEGQGTVLVKISPADENLEPGKYEIWYTTKTGVVLPEGGELYTDPGFEMTESGLVMAVLVEKATGKAVGQTCEVTVWVVPAPTGIDSVGADSSDAVRVEGSKIIAPEGSEVYDIAGRRVRPDSLRPGIYIVRTPDGKAIKLTVNN